MYHVRFHNIRTLGLEFILTNIDLRQTLKIIFTQKKYVYIVHTYLNQTTTEQYQDMDK